MHHKEEDEGDDGHEPATASGGASVRSKGNMREETRACDRKTCTKIWLGPLGNCQIQNVKPLGIGHIFSFAFAIGS